MQSFQHIIQYIKKYIKRRAHMRMNRREICMRQYKYCCNQVSTILYAIVECVIHDCLLTNFGRITCGYGAPSASMAIHALMAFEFTCRMPGNWNRKLLVYDLPTRTCDALYAGLRSAFSSYGLLGVALVGVNPAFHYQSGLHAIVTVADSASQIRALSSNIVVAGQQVNPLWLSLHS